MVPHLLSSSRYNIILFEWRRAPPTRASAERSSSGPPSRAPCNGSATAPPATTTSTTSTATGSGQRRAVDLEPAQQQRGPALPLPVDWRRERGDEQRCAPAAGRGRAAGACGGVRDGVWKGCEGRRRGTCLSVDSHLRWGGAGFGRRRGTPPPDRRRLDAFGERRVRRRGDGGSNRRAAR